MCIYKKINLLTTVETADHWIRYQAGGYVSSWRKTNTDWKGSNEGETGSLRELGQKESIIALIAHDAKKKRNERVYTTGALIRGWVHGKKILADKIILANSGPKGGDVQIAYEVLNNKCQVVIFFHDPMTAHPHDPDISLLRRTCQLPCIS